MKKSGLIHYLRLCDCSILPITHRTDVHALRSLLVTLLEELFHDASHPFDVDLPRLCGVGEVGTVHHVLENLDPVDVVVQQQHARSSHLFCFHHGLEISEEAHVL